MPRHAKTDQIRLTAQHKPFAPPLAHKVRIPHPYTPAAATDIRATFARLRRQQQAQERQQRVADAQAAQTDLFNQASDASQVLPFPAIQTMLKRKSA